VKVIKDLVNRTEKDFSYLNNPANLPQAYERSLVEIKRRRKFRRIIDEETKYI
jgi:hypothetical protein